MAKKFKTHEEYIKYMVKELSLHGRKLVENAYNTREFSNQTYNLHDSYGCAVYYNGILQSDSIYTMKSQADEPKHWYGKPIYGASEITDFFLEYRLNSKGFDLVVAAAMPYASILEHGEGSLTRKYRVITGIKGDMKNLAAKYNGKVHNSSTSRIV